LAFPEAGGRVRFGIDYDMRLRVTAQSAEDAKIAYRYLDDATVREMIRKYAGDAWRENEMAKVLRENDDLRLEVGEYLLGKLETLTHLPSRMYLDMTKNSGEEGYDRNLKSKEYATLIALSMLDGTFKSERATGDPVEMRHGSVTTGEHRYTALKLLGLDQSPVARIKKN
ncbi:hypothetical protein H7Y29_00185, partial [Microbacteriaceae bacterium]|nr:hypothetical protein [Candidatus Saccharibacteria bacterium]